MRTRPHALPRPRRPNSYLFGRKQGVPQHEEVASGRSRGGTTASPRHTKAYPFLSQDAHATAQLRVARQRRPASARTAPRRRVQRAYCSKRAGASVPTGVRLDRKGGSGSWQQVKCERLGKQMRATRSRRQATPRFSAACLSAHAVSDESGRAVRPTANSTVAAPNVKYLRAAGCRRAAGRGGRALGGGAAVYCPGRPASGRASR